MLDDRPPSSSSPSPPPAAALRQRRERTSRHAAERAAKQSGVARRRSRRETLLGCCCCFRSGGRKRLQAELGAAPVAALGVVPGAFTAAHSFVSHRCTPNTSITSSSSHKQPDALDGVTRTQTDPLRDRAVLLLLLSKNLLGAEGLVRRLAAVIVSSSCQSLRCHSHALSSRRSVRPSANCAAAVPLGAFSLFNAVLCSRAGRLVDWLAAGDG